MTGCARNAHTCARCDGELPFEFTMAFQPIVDLDRGGVYAYEALVRGTAGESAFDILSRVDETLLYRFDQACRVRALRLAHTLGLAGSISINFLPNAVYEPKACIQATLEVAGELGWPLERICFEISETEYVTDRRHLQRIVDAYKAMGFKTALDDFGTGYANLDLLLDFLPDVVKLDRQLITGVDASPRRQAIVESTAALCRRLGVDVIAEGVETLAEARWLYRSGIVRHQGYLYARPAVEQLPAGDAEALAAAVR